jgi:hypothetical protein
VLAAAGASILLAAACTGDGDGAPAPTSAAASTSTTAPAVPVADLGATQATRFFTSLAARSPGLGEDLVAATAPGSPARAYATHQAVARTVLGPGTPAAVQVLADRAVLCESDQSACATYTAVTVEPVGGLLWSFSVDGVPVADTVRGGGPPVTLGGVSLQALSAYASPPAGLVQVLVEVTNSSTDAFRPFAFAAVYTPASLGPTVDAAGAWGPERVGAGATGRFLVTFAGGEPDGLLTVNGLAGDTDLRFEVDVGSGATGEA